MLDINAMMKEEVMNEVVINGTLVGKFDDTQTKKIIEFIKGGMKTTSKVTANAPSTVVEKKSFKESMFDILHKKPSKELFWNSDLVVVTLEGKEYRARFNYRLIKAMSKDKETNKFSARKYEFMKELFKKQLTDLGAKWVSNDDEADFGWYVFPTKKSAEEYRKLRKADDKKYAKES